jgi:hypothetical protein
MFKWATGGACSTHGRGEKYIRYCSTKLKGRNHIGDLVVGMRISEKWGSWTDSCGPR